LDGAEAAAGVGFTAVSGAGAVFTGVDGAGDDLAADAFTAAGLADSVFNKSLLAAILFDFLTLLIEIGTIRESDRSNIPRQNPASNGCAGQGKEQPGASIPRKTEPARGMMRCSAREKMFLFGQSEKRPSRGFTFRGGSDSIGLGNDFYDFQLLKASMTYNQTPTLNRRQFLRRSAVAAAAPMVLPAATLGLNGAVAPSNRVAFGAIGVGNRARAILPNFLSFKEIRFVAVSDCRAERLKSAKEIVDNHYGDQECVAYPDFRELLARKEIDAVLIATGNRWHGLGSIYAARAGKDIYCEKPVTLTIGEGRKLVETCRRQGTIYQAGTQRRSTASYRFAREIVRQGKIGRLKTVEMQVWVGPSFGHEKATALPTGWNYDIWLGQTPWHPFVPARVNNWQYFWDTAEGIITDMGCHYTDQLQWVLGTDDTGPGEFEIEGQLPDAAQFCSDTPVTAVGRCKYANGVIGVMYQRGEFKDRYIRYIGEEAGSRWTTRRTLSRRSPNPF
jgi:predicted dehydrogenase